MNTRNQSISLYFCDAKSDKEYHIDLLEKNDGSDSFTVDFRYGRRGNALACGSKTASPLPYAKALKVFEKLKAEKVGKGYTESESGEAYQGAANEARFTGILPQLLNPIDESEASALLASDDWCVEEKHDGERRLILIEDGVAVGNNKKGMAVPLPLGLAEKAASLSNGTIIDGELIGTRYVAFDLLQSGQKDCRNLPYSSRRRLLAEIAVAAGIEHTVTAESSEAKRALFAALLARKAEGSVFKLLSAPYTSDRPNSGGPQLKCKFYETATLKVAGVNAGKRSVGLLARDGDRWVDVGNVTIPPNAVVPPENAYIEVRYLYVASEGGSLYQPTYLGQRFDQDDSDCGLSQLKYKPLALAA